MESKHNDPSIQPAPVCTFAYVPETSKNKHAAAEVHTTQERVFRIWLLEGGGLSFTYKIAKEYFFKCSPSSSSGYSYSHMYV